MGIKKLVQFILVALWMALLYGTDARYQVYIVCGIVAAFSLYRFGNQAKAGDKVTIRVLAVVLAFLVLLANYPVYKEGHMAYNVALFTLLLVGGAQVFQSISILLFHWFDCEKRAKVQDITSRKERLCFFLGPFILIAVIDLGYLFLAAYPGVLTPDSVSQVRQLMTNVYSNHHPFWHTMLIKLWISVGLTIFGNMNAAVVLYSVFQILCMAAIFAFVVLTIYQSSHRPLYAILAWVYFAVMPYHIAYSCTMWKDVLFGACVALLITAVFRILTRVGRQNWINYFVLCVSGIGTGILRSNGWLALAVSGVVFAICLRRKNAKIVVTVLSLIVISGIIKGPVIKLLDVSDPAFAESLSIPIQQVARVIADGKELTEDQRELIEQVIPMELLAKDYKSYISDPIKGVLSKAEAGAYLQERKGDFFRLWLTLGMRYPGEYVKAWVDQTKGYWNGGYDYPYVALDIKASAGEYGISQVINSPIVARLFRGYFGIFRPVFGTVLSIGIYVWLVLIIFAYLINRRNVNALLCVPIIAIVLTLLVATPVAYEFRYIYAIFTSIPLLLYVAREFPTFAKGAAEDCEKYGGTQKKARARTGNGSGPCRLPILFKGQIPVDGIRIVRICFEGFKNLFALVGVRIRVLNIILIPILEAVEIALHHLIPRGKGGLEPGGDLQRGVHGLLIGVVPSQVVPGA